MFQDYNPKALLVSNKQSQHLKYVVLTNDNSVSEFLKDAHSGKYCLKMVNQIKLLRQNLRREPMTVLKPVPRKADEVKNEMTF